MNAVAAQIEASMQFVGNDGYEATVIGPTPGVPGMYDVRYPGGTCCHDGRDIQMFLQRGQEAA